MPVTFASTLDMLADRGYRLTRPRQAVLRALFEDDDWLRPEEVLTHAREHFPSVGLGDGLSHPGAPGGAGRRPPHPRRAGLPRLCIGRFGTWALSDLPVVSPGARVPRERGPLPAHPPDLAPHRFCRRGPPARAERNLRDLPAPQTFGAEAPERAVKGIRPELFAVAGFVALAACTPESRRRSRSPRSPRWTWRRESDCRLRPARRSSPRSWPTLEPRTSC